MSTRRTALHQFPGRPIAYHPEIAPHVGGIKAAVFLCQLVYWSPRAKDAEGWVYKSQLEWMFETGMSRDEIQSARKALKQRGLIEDRYERIDHQLYTRIVVNVFNTMIDQLWNLPTDQTPRKRLKVNHIGKAYMAKWALTTSGYRETPHGDVGDPDIAKGFSEIPESTPEKSRVLTQTEEAKALQAIHDYDLKTWNGNYAYCRRCHAHTRQWTCTPAG